MTKERQPDSTREAWDPPAWWLEELEEMRRIAPAVAKTMEELHMDAASASMMMAGAGEFGPLADEEGVRTI